MAFFSIRLPPLSFHPRHLSQRLRAKLPLSISCSLPPLRPHSRRKNHLRPKIPNSPFPPPSLYPPLPFAEHTESSFYADGSSLVVDDVVEAEDTYALFDASNALTPGAGHRWFPRPVLDLAARFAVLLAVQTAVAVWFLSRDDVEKVKQGSVEVAFTGKEKVNGAEKEMAVEDFERMVAEIREMASAARERETEANEGGVIEGDEGESKEAGRTKSSIAQIFMDEQGDGLVPKKKPRKLKLRNGGGRNFPKGKGFGGPKPIRSGSGLDKGGVQQIANLNPAEVSTKLCGRTKSDAQISDMNKKSFENEKIKRAPEKLARVNNVLISTEIKMDESKCSSENSIRDDSIENDAQDSLKNKKSSIALTARNDRYKAASMPGSHENQWWLKLPYVFGIFLHRGSAKGDKGLYSLQMNSATHDGKKQSYTITFQDRSDAMNFSILLESFFEDLGSVWADIVPLTIHELDDAIRSGEMRLIVARKGQLRLYAGQPLVEVENALRSFLE